MSREQPDAAPVCHVKGDEDQPVADAIRRRVGVWSAASRKAWRTRKNMAAHRAALLAAEREAEEEST